MKQLLLSVLFFASNFLIAQNFSKEEQQKVNRYDEIIASNAIDTVKIKAYLDLIEIIYVWDIDTVYYLSERSIELSEKGLKQKSNSKKLEIFYKRSLASAYNNIGFVDHFHGKVQSALFYYNNSLMLNEEVNDLSGLSTSYLNLGAIYSEEGDTEQAMAYYVKSLEIDIQSNDSSGIATSYNNIGSLLLELNDFEKSLSYHEKSLEIRKKIGERYSQAISLNNIGGTYERMKEFGKALKYFYESLEIYKDLHIKEGLGHEYVKIAQILFETGEIKQSKKNALKSYSINQEIGHVSNIKMSAELLSKIYRKEKDFRNAYAMQVVYQTMKDSLQNIEFTRAKVKQETKYEYENQMATDSIKHAELYNVKLLIGQNKYEESQKKKMYLYVGLGVLSILLFFLYRRFKVSQSQREFIEKQKGIVEKQHKQLEATHKEITDSINYAERIQRSFLATEDLLNANLKEHFVFYQPKDVVSGDFYWARQLNNGVFAMVNADSTGHGVPGAIMSIFNISSIEKAIDKGLTQPADIFNDTRKTIVERLEKDHSKHGGKDGMDASIICFDFNNLTMSYCAAQNPIWIIRDGEIIQIKPEKMPIGKHTNDHIPFVGGTMKLQKDDLVYTLTDGFQDQFGGPKGKKFMVKRMRELVLENSHLPLVDQHQKIIEVFNSWKANQEQVDDVCVIGVRL